ncbi:hypothetical protein AB0C10_36945 [Microbispora amethystogenes]|uniref:hypothetical protein n=1 Tax=Microbispora amethystogenes TaxID=1427754 RepID=UPI0033FB28F7
MTDTRELPAATGDPLTYRHQMVDRLREVVEAEIKRMTEQHEKDIADLRLMVTVLEDGADRPLDVLRLAPVVGRDPYANAPAWADRTDERVGRIASLREDGTESGEVAS